MVTSSSATSTLDGIESTVLADPGAKGGNVGLLDGSVIWKGIQQMRRYRGSQIWGADGCYGYW
ncbi:MAG: hypothetical protein WCP53_01485 [Verrucomicrobiota bacterium]